MQLMHESMNVRTLLQMLRTIVVIHLISFFQLGFIYPQPLTHLSFFPHSHSSAFSMPNSRRLSTLQRLSLAILQAAGPFNRRTLPGLWPRHPEGLLHLGPSCREAGLSHSPGGAEP